MYSLSTITLAVAAVLFVFYLLLALMPVRIYGMLEKFPRNLVWGRVLATLALVWSFWLLLNANINWIDERLPLVYALAPVVWLLVIIFMDDLLAVRALGGLFLLVPLPILNAAFVEDSNWRLVMVVFAYLLVIKGIMLVWSPYLFRKILQARLNTSASCRLAGVVGIAFSIVLAFLGLAVYA